MGEIENISEGESSEVSAVKKNFFVRIFESVRLYFRRKIILILEKIENFSFFKAVFIGIALGLLAFGVMLITIILWLTR